MAWLTTVHESAKIVPNPDPEVAERVAQASGSCQLTALDIAAELGVAESTISRAKNGKIRLTRSMARKLASLSPVSAHWLLFGLETENPAEMGREAEKPYLAGAREPPLRGPRERANVIRTEVAKCGLCRGEVESGAQVCRWCGAWLVWPEEDHVRSA